MPNPLTEQDRELLARAGELHRPLARAARVAHSNGTCLAIFGALTILVAMFGPDFPALLLGGCVLWVGIAERRAGARLRNADPAAPRLLARNELILMGAIALYGMLKLTLLRPTSESLEKLIGDSASGIDVKELLDSMTTAVYATVIIVALVYQGGMARYFSRKRPDVERFNAEVPHWARAVIEGMSGSAR